MGILGLIKDVIFLPVDIALDILTKQLINNKKRKNKGKVNNYELYNAL